MKLRSIYDWFMMGVHSCTFYGSGGGGGSSDSYGENFANSSGGSVNSSNDSSSQKAWAPQGDALSGVYNATDDALAGGGNFNKVWTPQAANNMNNNLKGGQNANAGQLAGGALGQAYGADTVAKYYGDSMVDSMSGPNNMQQAYGGTAGMLNNAARSDANVARNDMLNSTDARAAASGMSGSSRQGTAQAQGQQDINRNLQNTMAQNNQADVDRRMNVANQADQQLLQRQGMLQGDVNSITQAQQGGIGNTQQLNNMNMQGFDLGRQNLQNLGMGSQIYGTGPTTLSSSQGNTNSANWNNSQGYGWNSSDSSTNPSYSYKGV